MEARYYEIAINFIQRLVNAKNLEQIKKCHFFLHSYVDDMLTQQNPSVPIDYSPNDFQAFVENFQNVLYFKWDKTSSSSLVENQNRLAALMQPRVAKLTYEIKSGAQPDNLTEENLTWASLEKEHKRLVDAMWGDFHRLFDLLVTKDGYYTVTPLDNSVKMEMYCDCIYPKNWVDVDKVCVLPALWSTDDVIRKGISVAMDYHIKCWSYIDAFEQKAYMGEWYEIAFVNSSFEKAEDNTMQATATYSVGTVSKALGFMNVKNTMWVVDYQGNQITKEEEFTGTAMNSDRPGILTVRFSPLSFIGFDLPPPMSWVSLAMPAWPNYRIVWLGPIAQNSRGERQYSTSVVVSQKGGDEEHDLVWILSRSPKMDEGEYSRILVYLRSRGVDTRNLVRRVFPSDR